MESEIKKRPCRKWHILLGEYALGTIDERDRARLERHLARCPRCQRDVVEIEKTYRLLGDFELAKPAPFFAARVTSALQREAQAAVGGTAAERGRAGLRRWWRTPAFASAIAAASVAAVATVLFVKVWLPHPPEGVDLPTAGKAAPAAKAEKPDRREARAAVKETAAAEGRPPSEPRMARPDTSPPTEAGKTTATAPRTAPTEAPPSSETEAPLRETAASEEPATKVRPGKEKDRGVAEAPYAATAGEPYRFATPAPPAARARTRADDAGGSASRDEMRRLGRLADSDVKRPEFTELEEKSLIAADVEAWMDARLEADVERLTGDGAALVDYITPNGSLMAYFYELPAEEQKTLLSRLRREAEAASPAELLLYH